MPIYEYECNGCSERHEFIQKFSDAPKRKCPACGKSRLRKLVSAAAFHLKGSGWYVTDFRDNDKKKAKDDDKSDAKSASAPDSKTESKTESKSESKSEKTPAKKEGKKKGGTASTNP